MIKQLLFLLRISRSGFIARRYFVVNGFDGALTLLGLNVGFYVSGESSLSVIISACLGAAVALGVSGVSSAYISEAAEREKELHELEGAMVRDMTDTAHGQASRFAPWLIAVVNGLAPFLIGMVIILPLWLAQWRVALPLAPIEMALLTALMVLFLLGIIIGRIRGTFWLWSGLRTLLIALLTAALIYLLNPT
jgi:predicted membrane protein (TIGR00267 family)